MPNMSVAGPANTMSNRGSHWKSGDTTTAVDPPTISAIDPTSGHVGDSVTVTGTNFTGIITVRFNGITGTVGTITSQSPTSIAVTVPSGAADGPINVQNSAGNVDSATSFDVQAGGGVAPTYAANRTWHGLSGMSDIGTNRIQVWDSWKNVVGAPLKIVRVGVNWSSVEQSEGNYTFGGVDTLIKACFDLDIVPLISFNLSNNVYTGQGNLKVPGNATWDEWRDAYSDCFQALVNRYSKEGTAHPSSGVLASHNWNSKWVEYWEVYNEQNNFLFWASTDNANGYGIGNPDPIYFAELMAVCYDKGHAVGKGTVYIGNGGFAVGNLNYHGGDFKEWNFLETLIDWWDANYTKSTWGWADIPLDFCAHHPYINGRKPGTLPQGYYMPSHNATWNAYAYTAKIHNVLHAHGYGSLKIWGTESGGAHTADAITGYGNTPDTGRNKDMGSPEEMYAYFREHGRIWVGTDPWPTGSQLDVWNYGSPQLGPLLIHTGRDQFAHAYEVPHNREENMGFYEKTSADGWTGIGALKTKAGSSNDAPEGVKSVSGYADP